MALDDNSHTAQRHRIRLTLDRSLEQKLERIEPPFVFSCGQERSLTGIALRPFAVSAVSTWPWADCRWVGPGSNLHAYLRATIHELCHGCGAGLDPFDAEASGRFAFDINDIFVDMDTLHCLPTHEADRFILRDDVREIADAAASILVMRALGVEHSIEGVLLFIGVCGRMRVGLARTLLNLALRMPRSERIAWMAAGALVRCLREPAPDLTDDNT